MGRLCSDLIDDYVMGMFLFCFCFGTTCGIIVFAMTTATSIYFSLGRQCGPVLRLSLLHVYYEVGFSTSCIHRYKIMNLGKKTGGAKNSTI
jgi:hypothetical protein